MAGSAGGIKAARAYVEIGADDSQFQRALQNVQRAFGSVAKNVAIVGAGVSAAATAMLAPLALSVRTFESVGSQLNDMAVRTGFSVERLSELSYAAGQTSASIEDVETAVKKMQKTIGEAALGSEEAEKALAKIGLAANTLQALSPEDQFDAIADRLRSIQSPAERVAATLGIFGKSATSLIPMIQEMGALTDRARELDIVMSGGAAGAADKLGDAFADVRKVIQSVQNSIGSALAPALTTISLRVAEVVASVSAWVRDNQSLVVSLGAVAAGLAVAGAAITGLAAAIKLAEFSLSGIGTLVGVATGAFNFLVSPLGLAITLFGGLAGVVLANTGRMGEQIDWLGERFSDLAPRFREAFNIILSLLTSGQFGAAGRLAWAGLELAFAEGGAAIKETWAGVWRVLVTTVAVAMAETEKLIARGMAAINKTANYASNLIGAAIDGVAFGIASSIPGFNSGALLQQAIADRTQISDDTAQQNSAIDAQANAAIEAIDDRLMESVRLAVGDETDSIAELRKGIQEREQEFSRILASFAGNGPGGRLSTEADAFADGKTKTPFVGDPAQAPDKVKRAIDDAIKFSSPVSSFASLRGSTAGDGKMLSIADRQLSELKGLRRDVRDINTGVNVT